MHTDSTIYRPTGAGKAPSPITSFAKDEKDAGPKRLVDGFADYQNPRYSWSNWSREPRYLKVVFDPLKTTQVRASLQAAAGKALGVTEFEAFKSGASVP